MKLVNLTFLALFLSTLAHAETQKITVMGVEVQAKNITYFADTKLINRFDVVTPVQFPLPRGNSIRASDTVYLHKNGIISTVTSIDEQNITWKTPDNREVNFDCSVYPDSISRPKAARLISFYENGEYNAGCNAYNGVQFLGADGIDVTAFGNLDVTPNFKLLYGQKVGNGWIKAGNALVHLLPGTEVAFFPSGNPRFFTLIHGEKFSIEHPTYKTLTFTQKAGKHVSTSLFDNGIVERGILDQEITHKTANVLIPKGSGVAFSKTTNEITDIFYNEPFPLQIQGYEIYSKYFSIEPRSYLLIVAKEFNFTNPNTGKVIFVPVGSQISLTLKKEIIGIRIPRSE